MVQHKGKPFSNTVAAATLLLLLTAAATNRQGVPIKFGKVTVAVCRSNLLINDKGFQT